ncbi:MAG: hypothetical protein KBA31_09765 [Alphaproteobacteria bacterium]|nr:hypothetical protein [Alphaproteobacteria bacterium]
MNLDLSSTQDWIRRVSLTHGAEGLCDSDWRFVAASASLLSSLRVTEDAFVGRRASEIPQFRAYASALAAIPLFDGTLRGVQFRSESWVDGELTAKDLDFWTICTGDGALLVHIVATKVQRREHGARFAGFRVSNVRAILLDGRTISGDAHLAFLS